MDFNIIFNKLYNKIPRDINPSQPTTKATYVGAFDVDFSMVLRERGSPTLQKKCIYSKRKIIP
jgi:hypothetical protein